MNFGFLRCTKFSPLSEVFAFAVSSTCNTSLPFFTGLNPSHPSVLSREPVVWRNASFPAEVQPRLIQGIRRRDG